MTREEILNMPAGRELDALIATEVLDWRVDDLTAYSPSGSANARNHHGDDDWLPYYSSDIGAAWEVVSKIREHSEDGLFEIFLFEIFVDNLAYDSQRELFMNITPLSICQAALLATMENEQNAAM